MSAADESALCKQYKTTKNPTVNNTGNSSYASAGTITFAASNNPSLGNVILSEFCDASYDVSEGSRTNQVGYTDGTPLYAQYVGGSTSISFKVDVENPFYTDNSSTKHWISSLQSSAKALAFNLSENTIASTNSFVGETSGNSWNANGFILYYNSGYTATYVTNYVSSPNSYSNGGEIAW